jgi:hypothetical protein
MKFCILCGCSEDEGKRQTCLQGRMQHKYVSSEERSNMSSKHKERYIG